MKKIEKPPAILVLFRLPNGEQRYFKGPVTPLDQKEAVERHKHAVREMKTPLCQEALNVLCGSNCERDVLIEVLLQGAQLELKPSAVLFRKAERQELERMICQMRDLSGRFLDARWFEMMKFFAGVPTVGPSSFGQLLRTYADNIEAALSNGSHLTRQMSGVDNLVILEHYVRTKTGSPHFPQLAILFGAVYGDPSISPEKLKALIRTFQRSPTRKGEDPRKSKPKS